MAILFASRDPLTGLMDRAGLHGALERALADSGRRDAPFGVVLFDIDRFKLINCGFGDQHGDHVLKEVSALALSALRPGDRVGRWGGQQFLCILHQSDSDQTDRFAEELRASIERHAVMFGMQRLHVTASFGVATFPKDGRFPRRLLAAAEAALYQAKESGRNRVMHASLVQQRVFGVGNILEKALRENRIIPTYQPIVDLRTGKVVAEESLARMVTPEGRVIEASQFIEVSQQLQLTYKIDHAIISHTFDRCRSSIEQKPPLTHFVNVSGNLLTHPDVLAQLLDQVRHYCDECDQRDIRVKPLVIEVTEREFLGDLKRAKAALMPFVELGMQLALDDFGSGYSTFQYLADLPFSFLKIEGGLVARVEEPRVRSILGGIQEIATDLGLVTLAEGIESGVVARHIADIGVDWGQGYYFDEAASRAGALASPILRAGDSVVKSFQDRLTPPIVGA